MITCNGTSLFQTFCRYERDESLVHKKADKLFADKEDSTEQRGGVLMAISEPYTRHVCWFSLFSLNLNTLAHNNYRRLSSFEQTSFEYKYFYILCTVPRNHCERFRSHASVDIP